jgi:drug/metabolite transporter (DMT)-like permease
LTGRGTGPTPNSGKENPALAEASLLLAVFFVGTDVVSIKYALDGFPPLVLMPVRYVVAGLLLLAAIGMLGRKGTVALGELPVLAGLGLVGVALNQIGYTAGLSLTSGSNALVVFATAPVWSLLLGIVLGLERGSWAGALGLGLAIAGRPS